MFIDPPRSSVAPVSLTAMANIGNGASVPITLKVEDDDCIIFHSQGSRNDVLGNYPLAWLRQVGECDGGVMESAF